MGDLVTFVTKKNVAGSSFVLHMSNLAELHADRGMITRALKNDHEYIVSGQEVNFAAVEARPTMFRVMVFQSCKQQDQAGVLKGEDVITLYHKNFSAFLHFDEEIHADPVFYLSKRVNNKARKKCAWMWKVERVEVMSAAHSVSATEDTIIRLKHLVTNMYLKQQEGTLAVTTSYLDPATQFSLKQFHKAADPEVVKHEDTIFVRGVSGAWLGLNAEDDDDNIRTVPTFLRHTEVAPDSEALIILPIRSTALSNVVEVQRLGLTISDFRKQLSVMPIRGKNSSESRANVFAVVDECYDGLLRVLRTLIVNCTYDSNPDPMSRDGKPNKLMQKLLRELGFITLLVDVLGLPVQRGVSLEELSMPNPEEKENVARLVHLMNLFYRLLKQMAKENLRNSRVLYTHLNLFRSHLGRGVLVTPTLKEIFAGKRELIKLIDKSLIDQFIQLLLKDKAPQYIDFLMSVCTCPEPQPAVQVRHRSSH